MKKIKCKPSYKKLINKREQLVNELRILIDKDFIRGSIRLQGNKCGGSKNCKCRRKENPVLHGPYEYLTFRGEKSNHSVLLGKSKKEKCKRAVENHKKIMKIVIKVSEINFKVLRYYSEKIEEKV